MKKKTNTAEVVRHTAHDKLAERLFDLQSQIGMVILLPAAHDGERATPALQEFIDSDINEDYVIAEFERVWPGFGAMLAKVDTKQEDYFRRAAILDLLQFRCPAPYIVQVEFTLKECIGRSAKDEYPCGTYRCGWGYYTSRWILSPTVEAAAERALELADQQKRQAWEKAKPKPSKRMAKT